MICDPSFWVIIVILFAVPALRKWVVFVLCALVVIAAGVHVYQNSPPMFWILLILFLLFCWSLMTGPLMDENSPESIAMRKNRGKSFREILSDEYKRYQQEQAEKQREQQEAQQQAQQAEHRDDLHEL